MARKAVLLVAVLSLIGAGCGNDTAEETSTTAVPATTTTTGAPTTTRATATTTEQPTTSAAPTTTVGLVSLPTYLREHGNFSTFVQVWDESDAFFNTLQTPGPYTVFAPSNEALAGLPEGTIETLKAEGELGNVLWYHVAPGAKRTVADLAGLGTVSSLTGPAITFTLDGDTLVLNETVRVVEPDIECSNGMIHMIDGFLEVPA